MVPNRAHLFAVIVALLACVAACQGSDSSAKPPLTEAQTQALSGMGKMLNRSGRLPVRDAPGGIRVDLQGGYQHAVMVEVNPDGTHTFVCTDSIDTATEFLTRTPQKADEK